MNYIKVSKAAEKWGLTARRVRMLCAEDKIEGVIRKGNLYMIPEDALKPYDGRKKGLYEEIEYLRTCYTTSYAFPIECFRRDVIRKKNFTLSDIKKLSTRMTDGEKDMLMDEFAVAFVYNSNAIYGNTLLYEDVEKILDGRVVDNHSVEELMETIGLNNALRYVIKTAKKGLELNEKILKKIHTNILLEYVDDRGAYRGIAGLQPFDEENAQPQMMLWTAQLLKRNDERKETMRDIERIAKLILEFITHGPFVKRNGTTALVMLNFELISSGYLPITIKAEHRERYLDAIDMYIKHKDEKPMVEILMEHIKSAFDVYFDIFSRLSKEELREIKDQVKEHKIVMKKNHSEQEKEYLAAMQLCMEGIAEDINNLYNDWEFRDIYQAYLKSQTKENNRKRKAKKAKKQKNREKR